MSASLGGAWDELNLRLKLSLASYFVNLGSVLDHNSRSGASHGCNEDATASAQTASHEIEL